MMKYEMLYILSTKLDDEAKEVFFRALMEIYLDSKSEAKGKYTPRQRARKSSSKKDV